jgi:NitT/TauT family transport system permease protein
MRLTSNVQDQMSRMMIFGISTFLIDSAISIALSISKDEVDYARSLRLSHWQLFREIVIYNKLPYFFSTIIQNFAIAWTLLSSVENISKSGGGIGVLLAESSKYMKLEEMYAIQLLILFTGILLDYLLNTLHGLLFPYIKLKKV